ncbi:MAG: FHA domain-containing protein [Anaerolineae bacterium]|jgi:hypothetical protein
MKALLVLQEGPGAGHTYPLDPVVKPVVSVGRSTTCDLVLDDHRSSRHHADFRWDGHHWLVVDQDSTNGTYVNGLQVHRPYELRLGDRVTCGETTLVLREPSAVGGREPSAVGGREPSAVGGREPSAVGGHPPVGAVREPPAPAVGERQPVGAAIAPGEGVREPPAPAALSPGLTTAFWVAQGIVTVAVICLAAGSFLPWLEITGSLSQELGGMLQGLANLVASLSGPDSVYNLSLRVEGLEGYGKLTLAVAAISLAALVVEIFFHRRSLIPAIVYLATGVLAVGAMALDLATYYNYYNQVKEMSLLFGIRMEEVAGFFDRLIDAQITPMIGLQLAGLGLVLLLAGGLVRLAVGLLARRGPA